MNVRLIQWFGIFLIFFCVATNGQSLEDQLRTQKNKIQTELIREAEKRRLEVNERDQIEQDILNSNKAYRLSCTYVARPGDSESFTKNLRGPSRIYSYLNHIFYEDKIYNCYQQGGRICYGGPTLYRIPIEIDGVLKFYENSKLIAEFDKRTGKFLVVDGTWIDEYNCHRKQLSR